MERGEIVTYSFWWTAPTGGVPIVSIASYGITFSNGAIEMLGKPEAVLIGFDEKNGVVGVKPLQGAETQNPKAFKFMERERQGYVRIGCKDFVKVLSSRTGIDLTGTTRYAAKLDDSEALLIVDLNKPLDAELGDEKE